MTKENNFSVYVREGNSSEVIKQIVQHFTNNNIETKIDVNKDNYQELSFETIKVTIKKPFESEKTLLIFHKFIKKLILDFDSIIGLFARGNVYGDKNKVYQFWYHLDDSSPFDPHSMKPSDYSIFDVGIIREKLFTAIIEDVGVTYNPTFQIGRKRLKVTFNIPKSEEKHWAGVEVIQSMLPEHEKISEVCCGPRYLTLYSFGIQVKSHNDGDIKDAIRKKLSQRGYEVISIEEV